MDDNRGLRWHQIIKRLDFSSTDVVPTSHLQKIAILGFCCDEGVRRNLGRVGAREGPAAIRNALSNLAVHFDTRRVMIADAGDVICSGNRMEAAQQQLGTLVYQLLKSGYLPVVLGGGHETAYGHFLGMRKFLKERKSQVCITNIDAHFDLRPYSVEGNSGTPFLQIAEQLAADRTPFRYMALGINESSNTRALFDSATDMNARWLTNLQIHAMDQSQLAQEFDSFLSQAAVAYLSIDLDVMQEAFAPGVSAPASIGLAPDELFQIVRKIAGLGTLIGVDVVEVNPQYDQDGRTARLAAQVIYQIVTQIINKK
jgi:formiminoglutamase